MYYKEKTPAVNLKGQLLAGKWSAVEILVKGSDIKLTVDGNAVTGSIPGGTTMAGAKSFIRIGATQDGARPFAGSLADIAVSEPAQ